MQKKVIALAIAGLVSGAAFAQSNVTVYGVMDAYAGVGKADNAAGNQSQTIVNQGGLSSSRLGFMGEEALGNGLKAIFKLELGSLDITGATNNIGNTRQAYVGLSSDKVGTIRLGRAQTLGWDWSVKYDVLGASNAYSPMGSIGGAKFLFTSSTALGRQPNAVSYISPTFSGVTVRGDVAAGEQVTGTNGVAGVNKAQKFYMLGVDYDNGPLAVGGGYGQISDLGGTLNNVNAQTMKDWALGATYNFNVAKPYLAYQQSKLTPIAGNDVTSKMWSTGVRVPVGNGLFNLAYVNYKNDATAQVKANGWALDYEHALSKRTTAYIGYQSISNGTNANFTVANAASVTTSVNKNANFYGLGVRHTF